MARQLDAQHRARAQRSAVIPGSFTRTNLFTNPSFEVAGGWSVGFAGTHSNSSAMLNDTAMPRYGTHNATIVNGDGANGHLYWQTTLPITPGQAYTFSAFVYLPSSAYTSGAIRLVLDDNAYNNLALSPTTSQLDQWVRLTVTAYIPTTGTPDGSNILRCAIDASGTALMTSYTDGALLEASPLLDSYFDGDTSGGAWSGTPHASTSYKTQARGLVQTRMSTAPKVQEFGVNTHGSTNVFATVAGLGMTWARADFSWTSIEATQGTFNWAGPDSIIAAAQAQGVNVLPIIDYSNPYANGGQSKMYPPTNPQDYADFAAAVVARYAPLGVMVYEIWNEPDISGFWMPSPDPVAYTALLKAAYTSMKAVNPNITVLTAGLAPITDTSSTHVPADVFLQAIYDNGGKNYFDHFNYHPYGWNVAQMINLRNIMVANGDAHKKIWLTEYGTPTFGAVGQSYDTEAKQALLISNAVKAVKQLDWAGPLILYELLDSQALTATTPDREGYFGFIRTDGTYKPALQALTNAIHDVYL